MATALAQFASEARVVPIAKARAERDQPPTPIAVPVRPSSHTTLWASEPEPGIRRELFIGRLMAAVVHPVAALRLLSVWWWLLILIAYAATAYLVVFGALLLIELP